MGHLYVGGSSLTTGDDITTSTGLHLQPHVAFNTSSRPDDGVHIETTAELDGTETVTVTGYPGYFRVGGGFYGSVDEVRVWSKDLSPAEVNADKFTRQVTSGKGRKVCSRCDTSYNLVLKR
jgi:hypothetical protein